MKKLIYLTAAALAAFAFTACEKTGGNENEETDPNFTENEGSFTYYGETYKTVTLENGSVWMAEPLRYVPEGYTVSADPADDDAHIWYPYAINEDGTTAALTDEASVNALGYLYDPYAAFIVSEINDDNKKSFEGIQGICPKGWHIPTKADFFALCGYASKAEGEEADQKDETAFLYDAASKGSNIGIFNEAGWNYVFSGAKTGTSYSKVVIDENKCSNPDFIGKPALNYIMASTYFNTMSSGTIQYYALMSTFTSAYKQGRLHLAGNNITNGVQVRCVKDAE